MTNEQLEKGYCTICRSMKFHTTEGVCAQCRETSLAEAERLLKNARILLAESEREDHPQFTLDNRQAEVERYQRLADFLAEEDWCEEVVRYATPESVQEAHARCEALVKAGATGVALDAREITVTWHSKVAREAYEEAMKYGQK